MLWLLSVLSMQVIIGTIPRILSISAPKQYGPFLYSGEGKWNAKMVIFHSATFSLDYQETSYCARERQEYLIFHFEDPRVSLMLPDYSVKTVVTETSWSILQSLLSGGTLAISHHSVTNQITHACVCGHTHSPLNTRQNYWKTANRPTIQN